MTEENYKGQQKQKLYITMCQQMLLPKVHHSHSVSNKHRKVQFQLQPFGFQWKLVRLLSL